MAARLKAHPGFSLQAGGAFVGCAGVWPYSGGVMAWAALTAAAGPYLFQITRMVGAYLDTLPHATVFAAINPVFPQADRWAKFLKFADTGKIAYSSPDGVNLRLYARSARPVGRPAHAVDLGRADAAGEPHALPGA